MQAKFQIKSSLELDTRTSKFSFDYFESRPLFKNIKFMVLILAHSLLLLRLLVQSSNYFQVKTDQRLNPYESKYDAQLLQSFHLHFINI